MKLPCTLFGIKADYENSTINTLKVTSFEEKFFGVVECTFNGNTFVTELLEGAGNDSRVRIRVRSNGILREFEAFIVKDKESGLLLDINTGVVVGENSTPVKFKTPSVVRDVQILHEDVVFQEPKYNKDYTKHVQEAKESENNAKRILEKVRLEHQEFLNAEKMQTNEILDNITESFNIHVNSVINEKLKPVLASARKTVNDLKEISNNVSSDIDTKIDLVEKVITDRVNSLFINHSETTKHSFSKFVSDIEDTSIQKWYATLSESFINDATNIVVKNEHALEGKYTDLINEVRKVSQERLNSIQDECNSLFEELNNHISLVKSSIDDSNVLTEESIERIQKSTNKYISEFKDVCLNESTNIIKNVSLDISDIVENYIYEKYDNIVDDKFKSLLESFEKNRKDELIVERSNTLEKTKKEILSSLKTEIANQFSTLKRYAEMVSGGGTVAVQYAQGGIINGELAIINPTGIALSTIGRILSGGVDLSTIISSIAPSVSAFSTFTVPGQGNVVADSLSDVITLSAGSNITITTDPTTDTVIFSANLTALNASNLTSGTLAAARMPALTGDITSSVGTVATTLATVNSNTGAFGSATAAPSFTVNAKGLITAASTNTITPAVSSIIGLGTGVATALAVNAGSAGSFVRTTDQGTAASRNVGQTAGNVLELSAAGEVALGGGVVNGKLKIWDQDEQGYIKLRSQGPNIVIESTNTGALRLELGNFEAAFNFDGNTVSQDYNFPNASGTLALTSQLPTFGTGVATALATNLGTTGSAALRLISSDTTPASPNAMDEWYDSATGARYVRYGSVWVETSGSTIGNALATTTSAGMVQGVGIDLPQAPVGTNVAYISQAGAIGRNFSSFLYTDFIGGGFSGSPGSAGDGFIFGTGASGTGSSVGKLNINVSGRAGILLLTTGTTATGYAAIDTWNNNNTYRYDDGQTVFESLIRLPVLSDATNEYVFSIGGGPQNNGVIGNDGAFFTYNRASFDANWQAVSKRNGSQTTTNSNVAVVADAWFRLALIVNATGTSITYYINGTLVATITTNIQTAGASRDGCLLLKTAGTTSVTANIDYYFLGKTFTAAR